MTRERANELLPIITEFANGKKIQVSYDGKNFKDITNPPFTDKGMYRIKIEPIINIVPFDKSDAPFLFNKMIRMKDNFKITGRILLVTENGVKLSVGSGFDSFQRLFEKFEFDDGKPCYKTIIYQ